MSLKIGVDARELEANPRGVGRVLLNLLKEWVIGSTGHRFVLYFKNTVPDLEFLASPLFETKLLPVPAPVRCDRVWEQIVLPFYLKKDQVDVYFSPSYTVPVAAACPTVVAIHDISYQSHPEWFAWRQQKLLRLFTRLSVRRAEKIICCSNSTRRELLRHYGGKLESKISTVYYAPEEKFLNPSPGRGRVASKYGITQPYFLFVGSLLKRRNIPLLLKAFKKVSDTFPDYRLVLIGNYDEMGDEYPLMVKTLSLGDRVIQRDYVPDDDLVEFFQSAFCFVHPSAYEGFALTVVEAMACGTAVIISNAEAMVEVTGGAARVVDPLDADTLAAAMRELVEQPGKREALVKSGLARARQTSWRDTAAAFMKIIEEAVSVADPQSK